MARHAVVDLAQVFSLPPVNNAPDRLPSERYEQMYQLLCQTGVSVCRDERSFERLKEMRALYEGYAEALSQYLRMPLPPWITDHPHKDNWQAVAKLRAKTEEANPSSPQDVPKPGLGQSIANYVDEHHDF
jgi:hypothetical protein